jgi:hypothetical protein
MLSRRHVAQGSAIAGLLGVVACASAPPPGDGRPVIEEIRATITNVEIAELDVYEGGSDTFVVCPPAGALGQSWVPPISSAPASGDGASVSFAITPPGEPVVDAAHLTDRQRGRAEVVLRQLRTRFRDCWHRGLFDDPTQNGHVALALHVGADGQVPSVESYGACSLSTNVVTCLRDTAKTMRFEATESDDTVIVPLVFAEGAPPRVSALPNDAYTADAFVAIEAARPSLRACAREARKGGGAPTASATLMIDVDAKGHVLHLHVDRFAGDHGELVCAAKAVGAVSFPPPPHGQAYITARVAVDPPSGTK